MQRPPEERSWDYVQERINFIQQMRDDIKSKNPQQERQDQSRDQTRDQTRVITRMAVPSSQGRESHNPMEMTFMAAESSMRAWERPWDTTRPEQRPIQPDPMEMTLMVAPSSQRDRQMAAVMERDRMVRNMISDGNGRPPMPMTNPQPRTELEVSRALMNPVVSMMNPEVVPNVFKPPVVYDEAGAVTGTEGSQCSAGVCEYKPKSGPTEQIAWKDGNNQASNVEEFITGGDLMASRSSGDIFGAGRGWY